MELSEDEIKLLNDNLVSGHTVKESDINSTKTNLRLNKYDCIEQCDVCNQVGGFMLKCTNCKQKLHLDCFYMVSYQDNQKDIVSWIKKILLQGMR